MLFSDVWSENAALFERLMEINSNPPILHYGFKGSGVILEVTDPHGTCPWGKGFKILIDVVRVPFKGHSVKVLLMQIHSQAQKSNFG